jgi:hypothetical protein
VRGAALQLTPAVSAYKLTTLFFELDHREPENTALRSDGAWLPAERGLELVDTPTGISLRQTSAACLSAAYPDAALQHFR